MTTLLKKSMAICTLGGLAMAGLLSSASAYAAVAVSCSENTDSNCTSTTMGGRWDQNFGNDEHNCLYLLPINPTLRVETPIGGIIETNDPVSCLGGLETTNLVSMSSAQVRIFSGTNDTAYSWSWNTDDLVNTGVAQFIPGGCSIGDFDSTSPVNVRNGSFDNGDTPSDGPRPIIEPLTLEFTLGDDVKGNATVSYYFVQGKNDCRSLSWTLKVGDAPVDSGPIADFKDGKYLVFDLKGLEGGEKVVLELVDADDGACDTISPNSIVAGLFISGTSVCGYCGDGFKEENEECDASDPTDPNAAMCSESCEIIESLGCRFTGGLNDVFEGNSYRAGGQVGANTGQQPQPKGEWTHRQQKGPAGKFTFHGGTASAPVGSEIDAIRCSDPGGCKPSGDPPSPVKQLDFDGIGNFKNIGTKTGNRIPDFMETANVSVGHGNGDFNGTLHWFEVNIDDLGEPGNTNPNKNPGDADAEMCPANGFGEKGAQELGNCSCSDFYRITIYDGVDATTVKRNDDGSIDKANMNTTDVIYQVWGYIDGGNLQLHHPTGFDLK